MKWLLHKDRWMIVLGILIILAYGVVLYGWEPWAAGGMP